MTEPNDTRQAVEEARGRLKMLADIMELSPYWQTEREANVPAMLRLILDHLAKVERALHGQSLRVEECYQIAGKALGYPWFKDDQKNFPGATEENGVCAGEHVAETLVEELATALHLREMEWETDRANLERERDEARDVASAHYDLEQHWNKEFHTERTLLTATQERVKALETALLPLASLIAFEREDWPDTMETVARPTVGDARRARALSTPEQAGEE